MYERGLELNSTRALIRTMAETGAALKFKCEKRLEWSDRKLENRRETGEAATS